MYKYIYAYIHIYINIYIYIYSVEDGTVDPGSSRSYSTPGNELLAQHINTGMSFL
jgi:hypothetical protein